MKKARKKSVRKAKKAVKKAKKAKKAVKRAHKLRSKARASLRKKGKPIPRNLRKGGMKKAKRRTTKAAKKAKSGKVSRKKVSRKPAKRSAAKSAKPPADPCKAYKEKQVANAALAKTLRRQVKFNPGRTELTSQGKAVLDKVAATLKQYTWMAVTAEGNSPAPGAAGTRLTSGRARSTVQYLKSKGCKNKFSERGKHSRLIGMIMYATGTNASGDKPPRGCGSAKTIAKKAYKKGAKKAKVVRRKRRL